MTAAPGCDATLLVALLAVYGGGLAFLAKTRRWGAAPWLVAAALVALEALQAFALVPWPHWLLAPPGTPGTIPLALAAFAWAAARKPRPLDPRLAWAILLAAPLVHQALAAFAGWGRLENGDALSFFPISRELSEQGLAGYLRGWIETPIANGRAFFGPWLWLLVFKTLSPIVRDPGVCALVACKVFSVAAATTVYAATAAAGQRLFDEQTGLWSALVLALAMPLFAFYGLFYFLDVPTSALCAAAALCALEAARRASAGWALACGAVFAAACACKLTAASLALPLAACLGLSAARARPKLAAAALGGFLAGPWLAVVWATGRPLGACGILVRKAVEAVRMMDSFYRVVPRSTFIMWDGEPVTRWFYLKHAAAIFGLPVLLLCLAAHALSSRKSEKRRPVIVLCCWLAAHLWLLSQFKTVEERYTLVVFPAAALVAGWALARLALATKRSLALGILAAAAAFSLGRFASVLKSEWRTVDFRAVDVLEPAWFPAPPFR